MNIINQVCEFLFRELGDLLFSLIKCNELFPELGVSLVESRESFPIVKLLNWKM